MMFSRSSVFRAMALLVVMVYTAGAAQAQQHPHQRHQALENKDLTDLLDADLDQPFRRMQEEGMTEAPSSAPTPSMTDGGEDGVDGERGFVTTSPTPSPAAMRDLETEAPVTSSATSWRSSASVASALAVVGSVAVAAVMA